MKLETQKPSYTPEEYLELEAKKTLSLQNINLKIQLNELDEQVDFVNGE